MCITKLLYKSTRLEIMRIDVRGKRLRVYRADSSTKLMVGLMHRQDLGGVDGMLLMPGRSARHGIWMLNMRFSIDIVWISEDGVVVDIVRNARPCASMFSCPTFRPRHDALYVLELAEGRARALDIGKGTKVRMADSRKS